MPLELLRDTGCRVTISSSRLGPGRNAQEQQQRQHQAPLPPHPNPLSPLSHLQVCQRKDWGSCHKFECDNLKKLRNNAAKAAAAGNSKPAFLVDPNEDAPVPQQVLFSYELFLQLRKSPSSCRRAPVGLINHGNNCYANAALQCLLYTKPLRAYLDQGLHSKDCNRPHDRDWCLLCVLSVSGVKQTPEPAAIKLAACVC